MSRNTHTDPETGEEYVRVTRVRDAKNHIEEGDSIRVEFTGEREMWDDRGDGEYYWGDRQSFICRSEVVGINTYDSAVGGGRVEITFRNGTTLNLGRRPTFNRAGKTWEKRNNKHDCTLFVFQDE